MSEVVITTQQMYDLLLKVDRTLTQAVTDLRATAATVSDHETRLRSIESEEDVSRRLGEMEKQIEAMSQQIEELKRRAYAVPGASVLIALAAIVLTLIRTY